MITFLINR